MTANGFEKHFNVLLILLLLLFHSGIENSRLEPLERREVGCRTVGGGRSCAIVTGKPDQFSVILVHSDGRRDINDIIIDPTTITHLFYMMSFEFGILGIMPCPSTQMSMLLC